MSWEHELFALFDDLEGQAGGARARPTARPSSPTAAARSTPPSRSPAG